MVPCVTEPKKLFIVTTGSKMESKEQIHLGIKSHLISISRRYLNISVNVDLTTFFKKPAKSKICLLYISSVEPRYTIWHHSYWKHNIPSVDLLFVLCCSHSHLWEQI